MTVHDKDWHDNEDRNEGGYPFAYGPVTKPRATVHPGSAIGGSLDLSTDNSKGKQVNPAIPWIVATGIGALCLGLMVGAIFGQKGAIESEGRAVRAEVRMEFQEQMKEFEARLRVAEYEASIAKNTVQKLEAKSP